MNVDSDQETSLAEAARSETDLSVARQRTTGSEDEQLAAALRRREPSAMEVLFERLSRQAFGLAYRILGDSAAAEDAVQEAFLTVWRQADRIDIRRGRLSSFVLTLVHNKSIDAIRARKGIRPGSSPDLSLIEVEGPDVVDRVFQRMGAQEIRQALAGLPDDQRRAVEMAYFEGMTHVDISEALGLPLGTVKSRLRLALDKLRVALGPR